MMSLAILLSAASFWQEQPDFRMSPARACEALADMAGRSEAVPRDLEGRALGFDWMSHGRIGMGNDPQSFSQFIPWTVVLAGPGNRKSSADVELRGLEVYLLSRESGEWSRGTFPRHWKGTKLTHQLRNQVVGDLEVRTEGGLEVVSVDAGSIAHFWPRGGRRPIDTSDIAGVYVTVEARIDPSDYEDGARFMMNMAADYWHTSTAKWDNMKSNGDVGISRLKYLRPEWRRFSMTTLGGDELHSLCRGN